MKYLFQILHALTKPSDDSAQNPHYYRFQHSPPKSWPLNNKSMEIGTKYTHNPLLKQLAIDVPWLRFYQSLTNFELRLLCSCVSESSQFWVPHLEWCVPQELSEMK